MARLLRRRSTPRRGWRSTAREAASRSLERGATTPLARVVPDARQDPAFDGVIIEASVLARLLGMKLLTLEGTIVLRPALVQQLADHSSPEDPVAPIERSAADPADPHQGIPSPGPRLAQARQLITASAEELRAVNGSVGR